MPHPGEGLKGKVAAAAVAGMAMGVGMTKLRRTSILLVVCNALVFLLGGFLISQTYRLCHLRLLLPFVAVSIAAALRIIVMLQTAFAQQAAATLIQDDHTSADDLVLRLHRRVIIATSFPQFQFPVLS